MAARSRRSLHSCLRNWIDAMPTALRSFDCRLIRINAAYSRLAQVSPSFDLGTRSRKCIRPVAKGAQALENQAQPGASAGHNCNCWIAANATAEDAFQPNALEGRDMSSSLPRKDGSKFDERWLSAIDRLLTVGMKLGPAAKKNAINKVLELVPEWTRGDCWRRLRQLRKLPEFAVVSSDDAGAAVASYTKRAPGCRGSSRPWTAADDDRLLNWAGYEPVKKIAQRLGRSESAVRFRMGALGMSAKVTDGWSLRSLRKLLRVSPNRIRFLIGTGLLRVRDPRITATSFAEFFEHQRASLDSAALERFATAQEKGDEGYSWDRAAGILGVDVERIQSLICAGTLKIVDPFVTDRQFEEFCKKHGNEINLSLLDPATAKWLIDEYGVPKAADNTGATSRARKHALIVRACKCGKKIAGNAYFRHVKTCQAATNAPVRQQSRGGSGTQQMWA